jgi:hypothetical protein
MEPTYYTGDLVVTRKASTYKVGDSVAFRVEGGNVIHRIIGGNGVTGFDTQGDNNSWVDNWKPTNADIIGKEWLHIAGAGKQVEKWREPQMFAALVGGMASFSLVSFKEAKKRRRGGKGMLREIHSIATTPNSGNGPGAAPPWALAGLGVAVIAALAFAYFAFGALRTPEAKSSLVERAAYSHNGAYEYTIQTEPSTLYPAGIVGPVVPQPAGQQQQETPPVYTRGAKKIDLAFTYNLKSQQALADVHGSLSADLLVTAQGEGGWTISRPLVASTTFDGPEAKARMSVDFASVQGLIDTVEKETGYTPPAYDLVVQPTVLLTGRVGSEEIKETYSTPFTLKYSKTTITSKPPLSATAPKSIGGPVTVPQHAAFGLSVPTARTVFSILTLGALGAAGVLALVVFLGWGQDETTQVRTRYGARLVPVTNVDVGGTNRVQVARLQDLAVLAQRDGKIIFRQKTHLGELFFVPDGLTTYEYLRVKLNRGA